MAEYFAFHAFIALSDGAVQVSKPSSGAGGTYGFRFAARVLDGVADGVGVGVAVGVAVGVTEAVASGVDAGLGVDARAAVDVGVAAA